MYTRNAGRHLKVLIVQLVQESRYCTRSISRYGYAELMVLYDYFTMYLLYTVSQFIVSVRLYIVFSNYFVLHHDI